MEINEIRRIAHADAQIISQWKYQPPYAVYSNTAGPEIMQELVGNEYYSALDTSRELVGFYCYKDPARVPCNSSNRYYADKSFLDIGLGLRPDLCGMGMGKSFLHAGIRFAESTYNVSKFRLAVIAMNFRAIRLYRGFGFVKVGSFTLPKVGYSLPFVVMEKNDTV